MTDRQLGRVLDALSDLESQPPLPHSEATPTQAETARIIHLASAEQVHTINKLLAHLDWSETARATFIKDRYRRTCPAMLSPRQANSLTMVLLNIAAARAVKERGGVSPVSRAMIRVEIPVLKARLGIDRKAVSDMSKEVSKDVN